MEPKRLRKTEKYVKRYIGIELVQESGEETDSWQMISVENCKNPVSNNEIAQHVAPRLDSHHSDEGVKSMEPAAQMAAAE